MLFSKLDCIACKRRPLILSIVRGFESLDLLNQDVYKCTCNVECTAVMLRSCTYYLCFIAVNVTSRVVFIILTVFVITINYISHE